MLLGHFLDVDPNIPDPDPSEGGNYPLDSYHLNLENSQVAVLEQFSTKRLKALKLTEIYESLNEVQGKSTLAKDGNDWIG